MKQIINMNNLNKNISLPSPDAEIESPQPFQKFYRNEMSNENENSNNK